ncbi:predicted protein [Uncinocarpus reesii 1704]|uniref:Uncharacterized protein n=1 Tax=Uncinocarpus reesii (strain UAMH 1704) TaxID=336963 RepID=C4JGM6_UNCRE|nr:uncharacterized protein UREG_02538 [Uncinocarpus reesii 1704]EEP77689.1 predicted protein [Uncinocarpus reesii 1704]
MGADVQTGALDTVLHKWAYIRGPQLTYPESYLTIFKSVAERLPDINARAKYDEDTPLHKIVAGLHQEEEVEGACDILFALDQPPDINAVNRKGWTAMYYSLLTERDPFRQAIYLLNKGANLTTYANDGKNIFFPITYNVVFSDQQSHDLILELLTHLVRTEAGLKDKKEAYEKYFRPAPANILALSEAAKAGRVQTMNLLLDLGFEKDINKLVETDPPFTVLDHALLSAASRRYDHMEALASYTSGAARKRARAAGNVYGRSNESPSRAAEAYAGSYKVLHLLRSRGAKRACELESLASSKRLDLRHMYPKYWLHPDVCDVMHLYWLGFPPETQPNRNDWDILYELSRYPENWRDQLVDILRELYEDGVWRPDLKLLERAVKGSSSAKATTLEVPDNEFLQKIVTLLTTLGKTDPSTAASDAKDQGSVWIEARETTSSGPNGLHRTIPGYNLEVELLGTKGLGKTRRVKAEAMFWGAHI